MARSYEAVVIGGGPGGYVAGIRLGQLGVKAAVVERARVGGVCLNWGCIPSKALIHVAKTYTALSGGAAFGLTAKGVELDISTTRAWKDDIVSKLTGGVAQLLKAAGTELIEGEADFLGPGRLLVKTSEGDEEVGFGSCIIAIGARPIQIPGFEFDGERVWSAKEAVNLPEIPGRLVVIGGGIIGLELGTVYAKLGSKVTVVEMMDSLLPGVDADMTRVVARKLKKLGVEVLTGARAKGFAKDAVEVETQEGVRRLDADRVLVAVGFKPNGDRLSLDRVGVKVRENGSIPVDARMQTNVPGIYAVGDITGAPYLAHRAFKQGEVAAEVIAGKPAAYDVLALPSAIFTDPEIASTGMTEAEAKAAGHEVNVGKFMLAANGRALGTGEAEGFVKAVVDAESGTLLGLHAVGPSASDIISEGTLGIEMGAVALDIGLTVHPHPSISEAVQEAVLAAIGEAIHAVNRKRR